MEDLFAIVGFIILTSIYGMVGIYFFLKPKRKERILLMFLFVFFLTSTEYSFALDVIEKPIKLLHVVDPIIPIPELELFKHESCIKTICANYSCSVRCSKQHCRISELSKDAVLGRNKIIKYCEANNLDCFVDTN